MMVQIYHNNFNLYTCLHKLNNKIDDGNIIFLKKIKLQKKYENPSIKIEKYALLYSDVSKTDLLIKK